MDIYNHNTCKYSNYQHLQNNNHLYNKIDNLPCDKSSTIPKFIYQFYFGQGNNMPLELQQNIENIKAMNPNWTHVLFRDGDIEKFIEKYYGKSMLSIYNMINPNYGASRADFFRYLLMYKKGGVYLDIKSTTRVNLDNTISVNDKYILSHWGKYIQYHGKLLNLQRGEFQQWHIITIPGHEFLREVIKQVIYNIFNYDTLHGVGRFGVLQLTGPITYTKTILNCINNGNTNYRLVKSNEDIGLRYTIYDNSKGDYKPKIIQTHSNLFKKHYTNLSEPIVSVSQNI